MTIEATISNRETKRLIYRSFVSGGLCAQEAKAVFADIQRATISPDERPLVCESGWQSKFLSRW